MIGSTELSGGAHLPCKDEQQDLIDFKGKKKRLIRNLRIRREFFASVRDGRCYRRRVDQNVLMQVDLRRGDRLEVGRRGRTFQCRVNRQVAKTRVLLEVALRLELVAQSARKVFQIFPRSRLQVAKSMSRCFQNLEHVYLPLCNIPAWGESVCGISRLFR